jgi:inositol oxygenase
MAVDDATSFVRFLMMNGHGADVAPERKVPAGGDPADLVLDAGFVVPDANAFGNTFR